MGRLTGKAARFKEYYLSLVSTLSVLYAILLAVLAFGQVVGAGNSLMHINRYLQMPQWAHRYIFPLLFTALMLLLAYHLWFKKRAALMVLVLFIVVKAAFDLAGGAHTREAVVSIVIAAFFLTAWSAFTVTPDPRHLRRCIVGAIIAVPALALYGSVGLYLGRHEYRVSANTTSLLKNTWLIVVGRGTVHFVGRDLLFDYTLVIISVVIIAYLLFTLFRPHGAPGEPSWGEEETARKIIEEHGGDSLSYFNTRRGKSYFFLGDECFIAYRVLAGMALISADPVGPEELFPRLLLDFKAHCARMGWRFSGVGQSARTAAVIEKMGVHTFLLGEESLVDVTSFTLEGRDTRKLRQSVTAMERQGICVEFMFNAGIPSHMKHELQEMSREWRGDNPETGFAMGLGRLLSVSDPDCLLVLAYDAQRCPVGFQYFAPMYPHEGVLARRHTDEGRRAQTDLRFPDRKDRALPQGARLSLHVAALHAAFHLLPPGQRAEAQPLLEHDVEAHQPIFPGDIRVQLRPEVLAAVGQPVPDLPQLYRVLPGRLYDDRRGVGAEAHAGTREDEA